MAESGYALLENRGVLALGGEDRASFLQGLVSNDVRLVGPDRAIYACLLTPQGKFLHDFFVAELGESFLIDCEGERRADLLRRLRMFKLRSRIELADVTDEYAVLAVLGNETPVDPGPDPGRAASVDGGVLFRDPRLAELGLRAILPKAAVERLGLPRLPADAYERRRLELGVPDGSRDMPVEKAILLENNIDALNGISWDKGCYMGQELTARTKYRGLIKKRLFPVSFTGEPPAPGSLIFDGNREVGEMRTGFDGRGLALLRLDGIQAAASGGRPLTTDGKEIRPPAEMAPAVADRES